MNLVLRLAAALIGAAGLVWLAGFLLPLKHEAAAELHVRATPEAVWAVLSAVENYHDWRRDVAGSDVMRPRPDLTWRQTDPKGRVMMHSEGIGRPAEKWVDRLSGGDFDVAGERVFLIVADTEGGSTVALKETLEIRSPIARFKARFVSGYARDLHALLEDLRKRLGE
jgi:hypothetical protein